MFRREIGDVKRGYVESALTSEFVFYGDRESILSVLRESMFRSLIPEVQEIQEQRMVPVQTLHGVGYFSSRFFEED
jgi:hypothetical protein